MKCKSCGQDYTKGAKFCSSCGEKIGRRNKVTAQNSKTELANNTSAPKLFDNPVFINSCYLLSGLIGLFGTNVTVGGNNLSAIQDPIGLLMFGCIFFSLYLNHSRKFIQLAYMCLFLTVCAFGEALTIQLMESKSVKPQIIILWLPVYSYLMAAIKCFKLSKLSK